MPDPTVSTPTPPVVDQSTPLDAGHTTTEFKLTRIVVIGGMVVGILGTVADALGGIVKLLPSAPPWLGAAAAIAGTVAATAASIYYTITRGQVKQAALAAAARPGGTLDSAAATLAGKT